MRTVIKIIVVALAIVAIAVPTVYFLMNGSNGQNTNQTDSPKTTPGPTETPSENAVITITYGKGATCPAGELYVDVHIKNDGYTNFQPSGSKFVLTMENVPYRYNFEGSQLLGWQNVDIPNGGRYDASIAFKDIPDTSAPFVLSYNSGSTEYNIVVQPE